MSSRRYPDEFTDKHICEHGARMYEVIFPTEYDLSPQADIMLE